MKRLLPLLLLALLALASGCHKEIPYEGPQQLSVTFDVKSPIGIEGAITALNGSLKATKSGKEIPLAFKANQATATLTEGEAYSLSLMATLQTASTEAEVEYKEDFTVEKKSSYTKVCQLAYTMPKSSFVISEIFFAGTRNLKGEQYDEDKYIKITNNSPITRYADGLALVESLWESTEKKEGITPNVIETHFVTDLVMQIPGSGRDYPVKPYESIILCHSAINHTAHNPSSIDLSKANFEWMCDKGYTDSETHDNPAVPNMKCLFISDPFGNGLLNWVMNNNGQKSYAIADLHGYTAEQLAKEYKYDYKEVMIIEGMTPMELPGQPALKLPLEWIIDAVNLGITNDYQWLPIAKVLDSGYAHVASDLNDDSRYGKKVVRKSTATNSQILVDTNNSSEDFISKEIK